MSLWRLRILPSLPLQHPLLKKVCYLHKARKRGKEEGREKGKERGKREEFFTRWLMMLPAANNHEFAAGFVAIRIHSQINSGHRSAVKYLKECGRWCWGILCWAAPKPWEANTEQVRDTLSQEPQGKDLLNQGTRWSALLKGDSQRQILFFFFLPFNTHLGER